jgi:AcrR family transcriptional regulator
MIQKTKEHELRKTEIINTTKTLFFQKGYDNTTIQDIIDTLGIAKGTFYYYFKSKEDLLDEIVDLMTTELSLRLQPIIKSKKNAIEKMNDVFRISTAYKVENIELFLVILKTLYRDDNLLLRDKMFQGSIKKNSPIISKIVKQGIKEKVFNTAYPDSMGEIMINLGRNINEAICKALINMQEAPEVLCDRMAQTMQMYQEMIERILGAPKGSMKIYVPGEFEEIVQSFVKRIQEQDSHEETKKRYKMW